MNNKQYPWLKTSILIVTEKNPIGKKIIAVAAHDLQFVTQAVVYSYVILRAQSDIGWIMFQVSGLFSQT